MTRSDAQRMADMLMAAEEITEITARGRAAYDSDIALRRAVERCLEIIGEAAKAVSTTTRAEHPGIAWSSMAKIRDRLSHHYHRVDQNQLWNVATTDIPELVEQLRTDKPT